MALFAGLSRRISRRRRYSDRAQIERLESRELLSASPTLTDVHLVGSVHAVRSIVLSFNEGLDPTTAQDPRAFLFGRPTPQNNSSSGFNIGDLLGFLRRPKARLVKAGKIQWASVTYDDTAHAVTLTPLRPFNGQAFIRILRVKGIGAHAVKDASETPLYGGQDGFIRWKFKAGNGKQIRYADADGDRITLKLKGPGRIYAFVRTNGDTDPFIFVDRAQPRSVLTGTVKQGRLGDGVANIAELEGAGQITSNMLGNSQFRVASTEA